MLAPLRAFGQSQFDAMQLQRLAQDSDNCSVAKSPPRAAGTSTVSKTAHSVPFAHGSMVMVTLGNPRDKFWGMILALAPEGLSMSGLELASFEDFVIMVKEGEPVTAAVVFFPMHRIERIELDLPDGSLPSLSQRFSAKTGIDPAALLDSRESNIPSSHVGVRASKDPA
jgi:hypothetical protein